MKHSCNYMIILATVIFWAVGGAMVPVTSYAVISSSQICTNDTATPPFLSGGVDPNLLLLIDNSGSMLDLGYVDQSAGAANCYDDTYDPNITYAGYFEQTVNFPNDLYVYDFTTGQFRRYGTHSALWSSPAFQYQYYTSYQVYVRMDGTPNVVGFVASGNFLNWAAASKIDIQKKILTGGKFEAAGGIHDTAGTNNHLIMEARGCGNKRFVKKYTLTTDNDPGNDASGVPFKLTLAVRPPRESTFPDWENATLYAAGAVVNDFGDLYYTVAGGTSNGTGVSDDTGIVWIAYTKTRWTSGASYTAGDIVSDPFKANTIDEGQLYLATTTGVAAGAGGVDTDSGVSWEPYNLTQIEVFKITETGFDNTPCNAAVDLLNVGGSQGQLKDNIDDCMAYTGGGSNPLADSNAAFNHAIHSCWYRSKQGVWPSGAGAVTSQINACENVYNNTEPWLITFDDQAYGCYGVYDWDAGTAGLQPLGYVGRCWKPAVAPTCLRWHPSKPGVCQQWSAGGVGAWDAAGYPTIDDCVDQAMKDYCQSVDIPEVVDPSDQVPGTTSATEGTFWNIPAVLTDSGVVAQLEQPLVVMRGLIEQPSVPTGLIQEFANDIRFGAMVFNNEGTAYECTQPDPHSLYDCTLSNNRDGGRVISYIGKSSAHTTSLVAALNGIKATSWTPIAEALYSALGFYGQNGALRLDPADFTIDPNNSAVDPVTDYCQDNNILVITEGASTADINDQVNAFATTAGVKDPDAADVADCGSLKGGTLLDDLAYFAQNSLGCYQFPTKNDADGNPQNKQNIATHVVVAGTLRDTGVDDECNPKELLTRAAENGGTALYDASDPSVLEDRLREAFAAIRAGAAAGSAASVISASRGGEGAAYQAIFWPSIELTSGATVEWTGEVHSLLVDSLGFLYEDSGSVKHAFDSNDARVEFFSDNNQTKACVGGLVAGACAPGNIKELDEVRYHWSAAEWLAEIKPTATDAALDILDNRIPASSMGNATPHVDYIDDVKKRFIFTWNDLDNDGLVDSGEVIDFTHGTDWAALGVSGGRGPVPLDFSVQTNAEVDDIIKWVRGLDQAGQRNRQLPYDFDHDTVDETVTWRLGDVIHSTPISVGAPAEGFHFLYRDDSYARYVAAYKKRRHMVYFGGNDGMMHAANAGFYDEANTRFCRDVNCSDEGPTPTFSPELGAELWAYIPYNLLPHLKCLTNISYEHKYYVDQRPRIFDVRIWEDNLASDPIHVGGWGTLLVGAMRFGGGRIKAGEVDLDGNGVADFADSRVFTSAYFVLDITDPERPPKLLAEMTRTTSAAEAEMGYTFAIPTLVVMKDEGPPVTYKWYLAMGSGPAWDAATGSINDALSGISDQNAKVAVMPLDWLGQGGSTARPFRITDAAPTAANNEGGSFTISDANSFISDLVSVDFELNENYKTDVVYFGTVSGSAAPYAGSMYRLVTRNPANHQNETLPSDWAALLTTLPTPIANNPVKLIDVNQPVTAAASVGTDGKNYWVYFGTGRFIDASDKTDSSQQTYYGIKEPLAFSGTVTNCQSSFTWQTVEKMDVNDGHHSTTPGDQWLLRVDQIQVAPAASGSAAVLSCAGGGTACLEISPITLTNFDALVDYIVGTGSGCEASPNHGTDGWYKQFLPLGNKERNVGQATLLGGLLTYTTYKPYNDACLPEGLGFLYGDYFQTGTPFYIPVFISDTNPTGLDAGGNVTDKVDLGRGLATTPNLHVGKQEGAKAFVQTSTGVIVEIPQPNLPLKNAKTGKSSWGEVK